jgi:catechol 2,3-dioxygenase-like lactoylglutathione lyase family enzyme
MAALSHVSLFVRDLERMREFYETTLGLQLLRADPHGARFEAGGAEIVLRPDPPFGDPEYRDFINQLKGNMRGMGASFHFDVDDVDSVFRSLAEKGVVLLDPEKNRRLEAPITRRDGRREFAVEDPEGYWLYFGGR